LKSEEKFLVAFITHDQNFIVNDFIDFLNKSIPSYIIPNFYLLVSSLPVSHHGKLDRRKLSSELIFNNKTHVFQKKFNQKSITTSSNEETVLKILEKTFNIYNISIKRCFFSIGTNSLLLARLVKEIELHYKLKLEQGDLMTIHTINEFKNIITKKESLSY